tara:strand:- start:2122 stop:2745 length:624 start_codon:yes stop_codon:yes gene_type:complete
VKLEGAQKKTPLAGTCSIATANYFFDSQSTGMNRFLLLLLIPFLVLGQCLPHSHAGSGAVDSDGHALRPHVHLHGHAHNDVHVHDDHHEHADEGESTSPSDSLAPAAEHDSDAVYSAASGQLLTRTSGAIGLEVQLTDCVAFFFCRSPSTIDHDGSLVIRLITIGLCQSIFSRPLFGCSGRPRSIFDCVHLPLRSGIRQQFKSTTSL